MLYTYRSGDRPLDGFTLKRGVGKGGFGEVYFAMSDGGKEVALKLLRGPTEIEKRGISHCLNLKHPNLVHVYDLRSDGRGDAWLVMEYVLGESLAHVIRRHPNGLPQNLAKEWFGSLARAVGFLHDHGVVHRDLKPANIFVENGTLKVGDYGLCKALGASLRDQTKSVGTVHYMAPEVGSGNYNRQVDVYACGIILYELLSGNIPFDGESDAEVLMKHLTAAPDLGKVPANFRAVVASALHKDPARRFGTMAEFARAVEAAALPTAVTAVPPVAGPVPVAPPMPTAIPVAAAVRVAAPAPLPVARPVLVRGKLADTLGAMVKAPAVVAGGMVPYGVVTQTDDGMALGKLFVLGTGLSWALLAGASGAGYKTADAWGRRLRFGALGLLAGLGAYWLDGWDLPRFGPAGPDSHTFLFGTVALPAEAAGALVRYLLYFGGVFAAGRWWRTSAPDRPDRFGLFPLVAAGFWGGLLVFLWPWASGSPVPGGVVPLVLAAAAAQAGSPWVPPPPRPPKRLRYSRG